jgi:hypothetical protein
VKGGAGSVVGKSEERGEKSGEHGEKSGERGVRRVVGEGGWDLIVKVRRVW